MTSTATPDNKPCPLSTKWAKEAIEGSRKHCFTCKAFEPDHIFQPATPLWLYTATFEIDEDTEEDTPCFTDDYIPVLALGHEHGRPIKPLVLPPCMSTPIWINPRWFSGASDITVLPFDEEVIRAVDSIAVLGQEPACGHATVNQLGYSSNVFDGFEYRGRNQDLWDLGR